MIEPNNPRKLRITLDRPLIIKSNEAPFNPRASMILLSSIEFQRVAKFLSY